jgi:radical SAM superfamily enzyme YgiQ (UPF0313 family)
MTGPQIAGAMEAASIIKNFFTSVPVVWGGVHASLTPEETIQNELVDIIVIGDGEDTFKELVEAIQHGRDKRLVEGIIFKDGKSIIKTPSRKQFPISQIEYPAYDLIDIESYNFTPQWAGEKTLPVLTSRGCPMRCAYCYNTQFSQKKWASLSPELTVSLFHKLVNQYGIRSISLLDDNFFVDLKRVRRICELIIKNNLCLDLHNVNCRADTIAKLDDDFLDLMKKAGIKQLFVGVESGSDKVLSYIKKDITVEQILAASTKMKKAGIKALYSFMAGFPHESIEEIKQTLCLMSRLLKENRDAIVFRLQLYTPFPGTELSNYASDLGMKLPNSLDEWSTYHYENINFDVFENHHKKFIENVAYYTNFLDYKMHVDLGLHRKLIAMLYSRILKFRIEQDFYPFMLELLPLKYFRNKVKPLKAIAN